APGAPPASSLPPSRASRRTSMPRRSCNRGLSQGSRWAKYAPRRSRKGWNSLSAPNGRTTTADSDGGLRDRELGALAMLELDDRQKHFVKFRYLGQLSWLEGKARGSQRHYYRLRMFAIV